MRSKSDLIRAGGVACEVCGQPIDPKTTWVVDTTARHGAPPCEVVLAARVKELEQQLKREQKQRT